MSAIRPQIADLLLARVFAVLAGQPVVADVPDRSPIHTALRAHGLLPHRPLIRMSRRRLPTGQPEFGHAIAGPEIG